jgi:hypothetical protein
MFYVWVGVFVGCVFFYFFLQKNCKFAKRPTTDDDFQKDMRQLSDESVAAFDEKKE